MARATRCDCTSDQCRNCSSQHKSASPLPHAAVMGAAHSTRGPGRRPPARALQKRASWQRVGVAARKAVLALVWVRTIPLRRLAPACVLRMWVWVWVRVSVLMLALDTQAVVMPLAAAMLLMLAWCWLVLVPETPLVPETLWRAAMLFLGTVAPPEVVVPPPRRTPPAVQLRVRHYQHQHQHQHQHQLVVAVWKTLLQVATRVSVKGWRGCQHDVDNVTATNESTHIHVR